MFVLFCLFALFLTACHGQKQKAKVMTVVEEPFIFPADDDNPEASGYLIDLLKELSTRAGFDYELEIKNDRKYGRKQKDGTWDGLVGALLEQKADIALAPLTVQSARTQAIDFTHPYMEVEVSMVTQRPEKGQKIPFHSIKTMAASNVKNGTIKYGTIKDGVVYDFFKDSKYKLYREMADNMKSFGDVAFPETVTQGISNVVGENNYVFLEESPIAQWYAARNCSVMIIDPEITIAGYAIGLKKDSPYKAKLNPEILAMKEDGTLDKLWDTWWTSQRQCNKPKICICEKEADSGDKSEELLPKNIFNTEGDAYGTASDTYKIVVNKNGYPFSYRPSFLSSKVGFSIDVVSALANRMGFKYRTNAVTDWGVKQKDGTFNGMIGALENAKAAIATGPFTIPREKDADTTETRLYKERLKVVDFTNPIMANISIGMIAKRPADGQRLDFESIKELADSDKDITVVKDGYIQGFIMESKDPSLQKIKNNLAEKNFAKSIPDAIESVKKSDGSLVFLEEEPFTAAYAAQDCDIVSVRSKIIIGDYAFAVLKDNTFIKEINSNLKVLKDDGTIDSLAKYHWYSVCPPYITKDEGKKIALTWG